MKLVLLRSSLAMFKMGQWCIRSFRMAMASFGVNGVLNLLYVFRLTFWLLVRIGSFRAGAVCEGEAVKKTEPSHTASKIEFCAIP